jgi:TrmH family RNA methyltransferase
MPDRITSTHNPRIRRAASLRRRDERESQQRCLIDGTREIGRALDAGIEIDELFVCESASNLDAAALVERCIERGVEPCHVSPPVFAKLAFGERNEGLVAIALPPRHSLAALQLPDEPLVAVLAGVEKPGTVGAVIRTADAAGLSALIVADGGTDPFNPNVIRASLGTLFTLPVIAANTRETLAWLRVRGFRIFTARVDGARPYTDASFTGPTAFVLGNEAIGLDSAWTGDEITAISLPMCGVGDSLNLSVAAGILFYEARRQRSHLA